MANTTTDARRALYGPRTVNEARPNAARLYDYFLGGASYTPIDRTVGEMLQRRAPHWVLGARLNRTFVRRSVQAMTAAGIDQFLDLGSGIPTGGNVHELARAMNLAAKTVYVDHETIACEMARHLLRNDPSTAILNLDLRLPETILEHPVTNELIDFNRPVGLMAIGVLPFVSDEDRPAELLARYREVLVPGSCVALSQVSDDCPDPAVRAEIDWVRSQYSGDDTLNVRPKAQIESWFDGLEMMEPGLVRYGRWRPEFPLTPAQVRCAYGYVGVGRVR